MSVPSYSNQPPAPPNNGKKLLLIILAVGGGIFLLACAGVCTGLFFLGRAANRVVMTEAENMLDEINKSRVDLEMPLVPALARSLAVAEQFPAVVEQIGTPLEPGNYHKTARNGALNPQGEIVKTDIAGPKGDAVLQLLAVQDDLGQWQATNITITLSDGTIIKVPDPPRLPPGAFPPNK